MKIFGHSGDLGDVVAAMPVMRALGGGILAIGNNHCPNFNRGRENLFGTRLNALRPLLESQPYIHGVEWRENLEGVTHDFSTFRHHERFGENLSDWQARHFGVKIDAAPWLTVNPRKEYSGRMVMARSPRNQTQWFPWADIAAQVGARALFVGMEAEHRAFEQLVGRSVEYAPTADFLHLTQILSAAKLFIGNQSCPFWIGCGLGVPLIQEVVTHCPNSIVIRDNAFYPTGPHDGRMLKKVLAEHLESV